MYFLKKTQLYLYYTLLLILRTYTHTRARTHASSSELCVALLWGQNQWIECCKQNNLSAKSASLLSLNPLHQLFQSNTCTLKMKIKYIRLMQKIRLGKVVSYDSGRSLFILIWGKTRWDLILYPRLMICIGMISQLLIRNSIQRNNYSKQTVNK